MRNYCRRGCAVKMRLLRGEGCTVLSDGVRSFGEGRDLALRNDSEIGIGNDDIKISCFLVVFLAHANSSFYYYISANFY